MNDEYKKATVFHWVCAQHDCSYDHQQEVPVEDVFDVARDIFEGGLNVMLLSSGDNIIIGVDDKRFQQR